MVIGIVQWVIISLILIMLVHHLFSFFKNTLTVPKVKDLVNQPSQLYKEIEQTLMSADNNDNDNNTIKLSSSNTNNNLDTKEMKNELKNFFDELSENKSDKQQLSNPTFSSSNSNFNFSNSNNSSNMFSEV